MYDAVRLDWVKVKITPTTSVLLRDQKQAVFVSAWDRNGLTNPKEPPNFAEIASYSSAFQRAINLQATSWSATRKIFATSVAEKSFFVPTSSVLSLTGNKMLSTGFNLGVGQSLVIPWNPQLLLGVLLSASTYNGASFAYPVLDNTQTWNFICEFEWGLTFKGLRYDKPEGGAPIPVAVSKINPVGQTTLAVRDPEPNDDMDVEGDEVITPQYDPVEGRLSLLIYKLHTAASGDRNLTMDANRPWLYYKPVNGKLVFDHTDKTGAIYLLLEIYQTSVRLSILYIPANASLSVPVNSSSTSYILPVVEGYTTSSPTTDIFYVRFAFGSDDPSNLVMQLTNVSQYNIVARDFFNANEVYVPLTQATETSLVPLESRYDVPVHIAGQVSGLSFPYNRNN